MSSNPGMLFDYPIFETFTEEELASAYMYFYETGTTTQQDVYSDGALSTVITQPVTANNSGQFSAIYLNPEAAYDYRVQLYSSGGELLSDTDPYVVPYNYDAVSDYISSAPYATLFTSSTSGIVPPSGGGTTNYLRADGTWDDPPGIAAALFTSTASGIVPLTGLTTSAASTAFLCADGTWSDPVASAQGYTLYAGLVSYSGAGSSVTVDFDIEFPTSFVAAVTECSVGGYSAGVSGGTVAGLTIATSELEGTAMTIYWMAVGY